VTTLDSLRGRRVVVTRPSEDAAELRDRLIAAGAVPLQVPLIAVERAASGADVRLAAQRLHDHWGTRWVAFTSANAVRFVAEAVDRPPDAGEVAAVGERTAAALAARGWHAGLIPPVRSGIGLADAMIDRGLAGARVWLPRGDLADAVVPGALEAAGAIVDAQVVYRTTMPRDAARRLTACGRIDAVILTSDSAVGNLVRAAGGPGHGPLANGTAIVCLGPATAAAARAAGLCVHGVAGAPGAGAMVHALADAFEAHESLR
jgi:uroporphyrinogen-III synthase